MKRPCLFLFIVCLAFGQIPRGLPPQHRTRDGDMRLPNGKSQRDEILKEDYKRNLDDAAELVKLAEDLKTDLERDDRYIVSVKTLKKTDDIEKLVKNIRGRLKRY
jgi:hypothetical protein